MPQAIPLAGMRTESLGYPRANRLVGASPASRGRSMHLAGPEHPRANPQEMPQGPLGHGPEVRNRTFTVLSR